MAMLSRNYLHKVQTNSTIIDVSLYFTEEVFQK